MKYLRLIPALLLGALMTACNTTKQLYEAQAYDEVILRLAPDICAGDMNVNHINYVAASYHKANQADHERIQALKASGQPDVWPEIYQRYCSMKGRNEALSCFPREVKRGMNYVQLDLDEEMAAARAKAENYLVAKAEQLLSTGNKADAEEAGNVIEQLRYTNPENAQILSLQTKYYLRSVDKVLLSIENEDERPLLPEFVAAIFAFDENELPTNVECANGRYSRKGVDTEVVIVVKDIQVSPVRLDEVTFTETQFGQSVDVTDHSQSKSVVVKGTLEYYYQDRHRCTVPFEVKSNFKHDYTTIRGDHDACSEETLSRLNNNQPVPVPTDESMLIDAAKKLNDLVARELSK